MALLTTPDSAFVWLSDTEMTRSCGASLTETLYGFPVTIYCTGELGTGKTTLLQGFARRLGIGENLTSPTFALEQRYSFPLSACPACPSEALRRREPCRRASRFPLTELLHLDLYRLSTREAQELVANSDNFDGIRCIEWADRLPDCGEKEGIHIYLSEILPGSDRKNCRELRVTFSDSLLPTRERIEQWRGDAALPAGVRRHCDAVAAFSARIAASFLGQGRFVRPLALTRAAEVHDLLRFVDFRQNGAHGTDEPTEEQQNTWIRWKERFPGQRHEAACATFLRGEGYDALAHIVEPHGLSLPHPSRTTIEQRILYYADKRVMSDTVVTLDERLADFRMRYGGTDMLGDAEIWYAGARRTEAELFPDGVPF